MSGGYPYYYQPSRSAGLPPINELSLNGPGYGHGGPPRSHHHSSDESDSNASSGGYSGSYAQSRSQDAPYVPSSSGSTQGGSTQGFGAGGRIPVAPEGHGQFALGQVAASPAASLQSLGSERSSSSQSSAYYPAYDASTGARRPGSVPQMGVTPASGHYPARAQTYPGGPPLTSRPPSRSVVEEVRYTAPQTVAIPASAEESAAESPELHMLRQQAHIPYPRPLRLESITLNSRYEKPVAPIHILAELAILGSRDGRMTLSGMCEAIEQHFPYYRRESESAGGPRASWQNTLRHNISLYREFEKEGRHADDPGRGGYWRLNFANGTGPSRPRKRGSRASSTRGARDEEGSDSSESSDGRVPGPSRMPSRASLQQGGSAPSARSQPYPIAPAPVPGYLPPGAAHPAFGVHGFPQPPVQGIFAPSGPVQRGSSGSSSGSSASGTQHDPRYRRG